MYTLLYDLVAFEVNQLLQQRVTENSDKMIWKINLLQFIDEAIDILDLFQRDRGLLSPRCMNFWHDLTTLDAVDAFTDDLERLIALLKTIL